MRIKGETLKGGWGESPQVRLRGLRFLIFSGCDKPEELNVDFRRIGNADF